MLYFNRSDQSLIIIQSCMTGYAECYSQLNTVHIIKKKKTPNKLDLNIISNQLYSVES